MPPEVPPSVTVTPERAVLPDLTAPEMEKYAVPVLPLKFWPVTLAPLTVIVVLLGVKVYPVLAGVTVYVPFTSPVKV